MMVILDCRIVKEREYKYRIKGHLEENNSGECHLEDENNNITIPEPSFWCKEINLFILQHKPMPWLIHNHCLRQFEYKVSAPFLGLSSYCHNHSILQSVLYWNKYTTLSPFFNQGHSFLPPSPTFTFSAVDDDSDFCLFSYHHCYCGYS